MKRLCLPGLGRRLAAPALFVGALGLAATAGCASETPIGTGGGGGANSGGAGGMTATVTTAASTSSSAGTTSGAGGDPATSASASGTGGMGGAPFIEPVGTAAYPTETEQNNQKSIANIVAAGTKGFTAALHPLGDVDVFAIDVTQGGSRLRAEISDGTGSCPLGANTYLRVFDKNGGLLASDKDSGAGGCSLLLPALNAGLQSLAVARYYIQVENLNIAPIDAYVVDIKLTAPSCSDGIVQLLGGEQCDDGANLAGDGCSPTCQLEGLFGTEVEPNNAPGTANALGAQSGFVGSISPVGDQDYFSFAVSVPGSSVAITVDNGLGACPSGFDSKIYLYDAANSELVNDDDSGPGTCSSILPANNPVAESLAVGTYYVKVEDLGNNDTTPFYVIGINVHPPACGDASVQLGEQCDDGNLVNGDGCSATCALEGNYLPETEANDTQATANPLGGADGFVAAISPIGDQDYFSFDVVTPGSSVFVQVTDGLNGCPNGFDSKLTLFSPVGALLTPALGGGTAKCSLLSPATSPAAANMAVGTYKVRVEYNGNNASIPSYVLKIKVVPPGCGDSVIQLPAEQCDDGNLTSGDGCDATCHSEAPYEIEPNDSKATATPQWPGFSKWIAAIAPPDHDYYAFTLAAPGNVSLTVHAVNDATTCPGDTLMHLLNVNGIEIAQDDDGGVFPCSSLTKALPAGTFYTWIQGYQDNKPIGPYQLDLAVN